MDGASKRQIPRSDKLMWLAGLDIGVMEMSLGEKSILTIPR